MNVAIVGFGIEGKAAYKYWSDQAAQITICDQDTNKQLPDGVEKQLGDDYLKDLDRFDVIFRTNGLNPEILLENNPGIADKITTSINEFLRVSPTKHIIGITGTKGKGTTSTLTAKMLETAGEHVLLGGNIGISAFDLLPKASPDTWVVLELSSFQLSDLKYSPAIAVCLMVVPEHLNWHGDMDEYILAKAHLFEHQSPADLAIYYSKNDISRRIAGYSPALKMPYYASPGAFVQNGEIIIAGNTVCRTDELKLLGEHNWQNVCAALTVVWQVTQNIEAVRSVLTSFSGLPHRLEFVREANGVKYYNDSFAATPDAAMAAMDAIKEPKVMIMGGFDRNLPLDHLAGAIAGHEDDIRKVVIIGASGERFASELEKVGFSKYFTESSKSMEDIVATAKSQAQEGDAVLLSPGFASFDMFKNFEDRGLQFKSAVENI
jgi:UDP-N-acetylmuramoylalanine--D-glutamate ligase